MTTIEVVIPQEPNALSNVLSLIEQQLPEWTFSPIVTSFKDEWIAKYEQSPKHFVFDLDNKKFMWWGDSGFDTSDFSDAVCVTSIGVAINLVYFVKENQTLLTEKPKRKEESPIKTYDTNAPEPGLASLLGEMTNPCLEIPISEPKEVKFPFSASVSYKMLKDYGLVNNINNVAAEHFIKHKKSPPIFTEDYMEMVIKPPTPVPYIDMKKVYEYLAKIAKKTQIPVITSIQKSPTSYPTWDDCGHEYA